MSAVDLPVLTREQAHETLFGDILTLHETRSATFLPGALDDANPYRAWIAETGLVPAAAAGHSLGEYTALVASGAISSLRARQEGCASFHDSQ